ncbi:MAG TPA: response regulator [Ktedonobacterales bacterium]|nr:response regulator [Ktedonobacterales bacterium]
MEAEDVTYNDAPARVGVQRVLVVDDDIAIRHALRLLLEDEGLAVAEAADGRAALAILRATSDRYVVLLDQMMPHLDGLGVLSAIAKDARLHSQHSFVLMIACPRTLPPALVRLASSFAIPIIAKPFEADDMIATVTARVRRLATADSVGWQLEELAHAV